MGMVKNLIKHWKKISVTGIGLIILLVLFAWLRTMNMTEIEFSIHMNRDLIQVSTYGEPPTFAIWLENNRGERANVYVTRRAFEGDWEGKPEVPVSLPYWFHLFRSDNDESDKRSSGFLETDAITGATPRDEYFIIRVKVPKDSVYQFWIEMNLAGDYNDYYKEMDLTKMISDEFGNGQPALIYHAKIRAIRGYSVKPEIIGMTLIPDSTGKIIRPPVGITTADKVFDTIRVEVVRPKPYLIRSYFK